MHKQQGVVEEGSSTPQPSRWPPPFWDDGLASLIEGLGDQPPVATPTTTVAIETTMPPHFTHSVP